MIVAEWQAILAADPKLAIEMQAAFSARMCAAQRDLTAVAKGSTNPSQGYKYTSATDVQASVSHALAAHGLHVMDVQNEMVKIDTQSTSRGAEWQRVITRTTVTVGDGVFFVRGSGFGGGADPGDKATMKSNTAAYKYALCAALCIAMGDDPEASKDDVATLDAGLVWFGPHRGKSIASASYGFACKYFDTASQKGATQEHLDHIANRIAQLETTKGNEDVK